MAKVLVVEDDVSILNSYAFVLSKKGYEVTPVGDAKLALAECAKQQFDVIVLDMLLPEISGIDFMKQANLKMTSPDTKVIVLSNTESAKIQEEAMALGAVEYVLKVEATPYDLADKIAALIK